VPRHLHVLTTRLTKGTAGGQYPLPVPWAFGGCIRGGDKTKSTSKVGNITAAGPASVRWGGGVRNLCAPGIAPGHSASAMTEKTDPTSAQVYLFREGL